VAYDVTNIYCAATYLHPSWNYCKNDLAAKLNIKQCLEPLPKAQSVTTLTTIQHITPPPSQEPKQLILKICTFQVLTVASMKTTVVWDVAPWLIQSRRFRGAYYLNNQGNAMTMEAVSMSEMSVNFGQATCCNIPDDSHLHTRHCENPKCHLYKLHPW
jgi:hypothetical protein